MPYVITTLCTNDGACVEVCPVSCIHTTPGAPQFYIGRTLYNSWTDVPDSYKVSNSQQQSSDKSTLSTFTFTWK